MSSRGRTSQRNVQKSDRFNSSLTVKLSFIVCNHRKVIKFVFVFVVFSVCRERRRLCTTTAGQNCTDTDTTVTLTTTADDCSSDASCLCLCRTKIDEINQRKEEEQKATNLRIQKLQSDVMAANQVGP